MDDVMCFESKANAKWGVGQSGNLSQNIRVLHKL